MPCYHPLSAWQGPAKWQSGKERIAFKKTRGAKPLELPCGQCIGCRLEKSRQWAVRCVHEASLHESNAFVTLTYDDKHLPSDGNLDKKHYVDFMKRLRWHYGPTRFFHCGEYGERFQRPHHHACLFGIDFPDKQHLKGTGELALYNSPELDKIWGHGFCSIGELTFESAAYVARYVVKKITGPRADAHYKHPDTGLNVEPEYVTMSRNGGIGKNWLATWGLQEVYPADEVITRGHPARPPRFYDKALELADPAAWAALRDKRIANRNTEDQTERRRKDREIVKLAQLNHLKRGFECAT